MSSFLTKWPLLVILMASAGLAQEARHAMTFKDLLALGRVSDSQISPEARSIAYVVTRYSLEKNSGNSDVWVSDIQGRNPRQLTQSEKRDNNPRWSPDGKSLAFVSSREGGPQIWIMPLSGGEARKLTSISTGVNEMIQSRDGKYFAFTSEVYPDCKDDPCNKARDAAAESSKVKAKIFDRLLYRHWDSWKDGKRTHIFVMPSEGGVAHDVTPGDFDSPPFSLGGPTDFDFSPDGTELCFSRNADKVEASSTNSDLWIVPTSGGEPKKLTTNPAFDGSPQYSPDGRFVAFRAQKRPGCESDRFELMLLERATRAIRSISAGLDRSVGEFSWAPDSKTIYFSSEDSGYSSVFRAEPGGGAPVRIIESTFNADVQVSRDGKSLVFLRQSISGPSEVYRSDADGRSVARVTSVNESVLRQIDFGQVERLSHKGSGGVEIQGWLVKPPKFDPTKKWPALVLIHGGPQNAWNDAFSFRWNLQMFAARGYVVYAPNPRGSTGFGQKFTDEISGDWGGKVYEDIMKGVDQVAALPFVDANRIAAAGASYGGYMVNWLAGHTDRFRCLVSHDGVYNLVSMYGGTEELWFPEWEFRGMPWTNPEAYSRWSPSNFVKNFKTPTLIVHGELDYRVPVSEGFQFFTALQRLNVPSKFLYFPDEGHWVLKPQNSELWYKTVLDWIEQWTR